MKLAFAFGLASVAMAGLCVYEEDKCSPNPGAVDVDAGKLTICSTVDQVRCSGENLVEENCTSVNKTAAGEGCQWSENLEVCFPTETDICQYLDCSEISSKMLIFGLTCGFSPNSTACLEHTIEEVDSIGFIESSINAQRQKENCPGTPPPMNLDCFCGEGVFDPTKSLGDTKCNLMAMWLPMMGGGATTCQETKTNLEKIPPSCSYDDEMPAGDATAAEEACKVIATKGDCEAGTASGDCQWEDPASIGVVLKAMCCSGPPMDLDCLCKEGGTFDGSKQLGDATCSQVAAYLPVLSGGGSTCQEVAKNIANIEPKCSNDDDMPAADPDACKAKATKDECEDSGCDWDNPAMMTNSFALGCCDGAYVPPLDCLCDKGVWNNNAMGMGKESCETYAMGAFYMGLQCAEAKVEFFGDKPHCDAKDDGPKGVCEALTTQTACEGDDTCEWNVPVEGAKLIGGLCCYLNEGEKAALCDNDNAKACVDRCKMCIDGGSADKNGDSCDTCKTCIDYISCFVDQPKPPERPKDPPKDPKTTSATMGAPSVAVAVVVASMVSVLL